MRTRFKLHLYLFLHCKKFAAGLSPGYAKPKTSATPLAYPGLALGWPQLRFLSAEMRFRDELQRASEVVRQGRPVRKGDRFSDVVHERPKYFKYRSRYSQ